MKTKIKLNSSGVRQMLRGSEVKDMIEQKAQSAANEAGNGYASRIHNSGERIIANVYPTTKEAWRDNMTNNTLLKVLHK